MSTVPQIGAEGDIFAGLATTGRIPKEYLTRGMDNLGMLGFIQRGTTRFLGMIHKKALGATKTVTTREHRIQEINELDRLIDITVASVSTDNHTTVSVSNQQAAQLVLNDMFYVKGLYVAIKTTPLQSGQVYAANSLGYTVNTVPATNVPPALGGRLGGWPISVNFSGTFGQSASDNTLFFTNYEPVLLIQKGANDSGGTGNTVLTLQRCWCGSGGMTEQGGRIIGLEAPSLVTTGTNTNDAGQIKIGTHQLMRGVPVFPEGGDAPTGIHRNPYLDNNFTQEFKYAVEITNESLIEKSYLNMSYLEIEQLLRSRQVVLDLERSYIWGIKGKSQDTLGRVMYAMGGVIDHIPKDLDHIIKYRNPSLSYPGMLDMLDDVFRLGGSEERDLYCGMGLYTEIQKTFFSSGYLRYDEEASKNFDIEIQSLYGAAGKVRIHPCYTLTEGGWDKRGLCIDNSAGSYRPVTHKDWDMKIKKNIQLPGQEIYKEVMVGVKGLERRNAAYQTILDFNI